jgi:pyruvate kinase
VRDLDELVEAVQAMMVELEWVKEGDLICIVAGTPFEVRGKTDLIKLHRIGEETHAT